MAFRFRKSIKIAPGVRLNVGKTGGSFTVGKRGATVNFGKRGIHGNVGIPGTGLSYRSKIADISSVSQNRKSPDRVSSAKAGQIEMQISLALQEDGSVTFKDEQGNILSEDYVRQAKSQNRGMITNWLQDNAGEINGEIASLVNIHLTTPSPDTEIIFTPERFTEQEPVPPSNNFIVPQPRKPILKKYGLLARNINMFRKSIDKRNRELQKNYKYQLKRWELGKSKFESNYVVEYQEYLEKLEQYRRAESEFNESQEKRKIFIEEERLTNPTAMQEFLAETLQSINWPRETLVSYEVIYGGKVVLLDVDLPEIEDMPDQQVRVNKKDLKLTYTDISETQRRKNYITHIHAIGFRLIGELFVSLPTVIGVVFSGYSQRRLST